MEGFSEPLVHDYGVDIRLVFSGQWQSSSRKNEYDGRKRNSSKRKER